jgi:hypothetical protein
VFVSGIALSEGAVDGIARRFKVALMASRISRRSLVLFSDAVAAAIAPRSTMPTENLAMNDPVGVLNVVA